MQFSGLRRPQHLVERHQWSSISDSESSSRANYAAKQVLMGVLKEMGHLSPFTHVYYFLHESSKLIMVLVYPHNDTE